MIGATRDGGHRRRPAVARRAVPGWAVPVIEIRAASRVYDMGGLTVPALLEADLRVEQGEFVAIVGPSGSGKSTLMNLIGCLDRPTSGEVRLVGRSVAELDDDGLAAMRSRFIGFIFQSYNLLPRTTALENVAAPLLYQGVGRRERLERGRATCSSGSASATGPATSRPSCPAAQQQRVAIARALVDEPAAHPGRRADRQPRQPLRRRGHGHPPRRSTQSGRTIVLITHDAEVASSARAPGPHPRRTVDARERPRARPARPRPPGGEPAPGAPSRCSASSSASPRSSPSWRSARARRPGSPRQLQSLGTNLLTVNPGAQTTGLVRGARGSATTLTVDDAAAIARAAGRRRDRARDRPPRRVVVSEHRQHDDVDRRARRPTTSTVRNYDVWQGTFLTPVEVAQGLRVAVLGATTADDLGSSTTGGRDDGHDRRPAVTRSSASSRPRAAPASQNQDDQVLVPLGDRDRSTSPAPTRVRTDRGQRRLGRRDDRRPRDAITAHAPRPATRSPRPTRATSRSRPRPSC